MVTIAIPAYDRPQALSRLLRSLGLAAIPGEIPIVVSVDGGGEHREEVLAVAEEARRKLRQLEVHAHEERLGLKGNVTYCARFVEACGAVVLLEDDTYVSRYFLSFVEAGLDRYARDERIAGVALFGQQFNETARLPFDALPDGHDVSFIQVACSWGQLWTTSQWAGFANWWEAWLATSSSERVIREELLPANVRRWGAQSWKRLFQLYMIESDRYFVYPRVALSTNFSDAGSHLKKNNTFQNPLLLGEKRWRLPSLDESGSVYDAYCEILPNVLRRHATIDLPDEFVVDLHGTKRLGQQTVALSQKIPRMSHRSFGLDMRPHEMNIIEAVDGRFFSLGVGPWRHSPPRRIRHMLFHSRLKSSLGTLRRIVLGD